MRAEHLTEHFSWLEARCRCGCEMPPSVRANVRQLALALETARALVGAPLHVVSWYRCEAHNRACGGSPKSQHLHGLAADIRCRTLSASKLYALLDNAQRVGLLPPGGLGLYLDRPAEKQFVHLDIRGHLARWQEGGENHA